MWFLLPDEGITPEELLITGDSGLPLFVGVVNYPAG